MKNFMNFHTLVGLLQGLVIAVFAFLEDNDKAYSHFKTVVIEDVLLYTVTFSLSITLLFIQLTPKLHLLKFSTQLQSWVMLVGFNALMWVLGYQFLSGLDDDFYGIWFLIYALGAYFILPFIQLSSEGATTFNSWFCGSYHQLFSNAWCNGILVAFGWLCAGVVWLVLALWWELFEVINISFFKTLFTSKWFAWPVLGMVFGTGIYTAQNQLSIIDNLKRLLLKMCGLLLPLVALLTLSFVASVAVTGIERVWDTGVATPLILTLVFLNILLINGASLPEKSAAQSLALPQKLILRIAIYINIAALTALTAIAAYSTFLRIDQYGWTVPRSYLALLVLTMSIYSLAYIGLIVVASTNFNWLRRVNVTITWSVLVLIVLTHNPLFNPVNLTINSQLNRLASQQVTPQDFEYELLHFELGERGKTALEEFIRTEQHPAMNDITRFIEAIKLSESRYDWRHKKANMLAKPIHFNWLTEQHIDDVVLTDLIKTGDFRQQVCQEKACYVIAINLDNDDVLEAIILMGAGPMVSVIDRNERTNYQWAMVGSLSNAAHSYHDYDKLVKELEENGINAVPRVYKSIKIGDRIYDIKANYTNYIK
ncbi:hypothetical protein ACMAZF_17525 [Psychrobium sp. nBUS_13]|uniref:hypothetical protein n=1 Tax=Psychrobium sp. nBUS_13 TaxID=3395319 RepID=UPI003EC0E43D